MAYALGLIAVFHAKLELEKVVPVLKSMLGDPAMASHAEDSLEDIQHYLVKLKGKYRAKRFPPS